MLFGNLPADGPAAINIKKLPRHLGSVDGSSRDLSLTYERPSSNDLFRHNSRYIGQPEIASAVPIRQPLVIESEQVQHGRVEIVDVHAVFDGVVADVVRGSVNEPGFDAAIPGEAVREANARNGRLSFCALVFFAHATTEKPDI